jgi:Amt family ammonium transporter
MINSGDTAWILVSSALVMLMTPGLAFFYGGMVRRKNVLSTIMMSFAILLLVSFLWIVYGYSLAFGPDKGGVIGGLDWFVLNGVGQLPSAVYALTVPHLAFMIYQAMFAVISVALFTGAIVERIKFSSVMIFAFLWLTLVYIPVAHWVWASGGWLSKLGVLDFAGGIVVHINAGVSALALALVLGPRKGYGTDTMAPSNITMVVLGAALLWFGWFGFNAGSALTAGGLASSAFVTTNTAGATAGLVWMLLSWYHRRPSLLGAVTGAVVGLAAITPAAGYVQPWVGIIIGLVASVLSYYMMLFRSKKMAVDESLDVWACHGLGGTWGTLAVGIFATTAVNPAGADGLIAGNTRLIIAQLIATAVVWVFSFGMTWILANFVKMTIGFRVNEIEERIGLDISQHGEKTYSGIP